MILTITHRRHQQRTEISQLPGIVNGAGGHPSGYDACLQMPRAVADLPGRVDLNPGQLQESFPRRVQIATSFHCTPDKASLLQIIDPRPTRKGVSATCRVSNCACRSTNSCTWPVDWAQDYFVCRPGSKGHPQIRQHVSSVCCQSD